MVTTKSLGSPLAYRWEKRWYLFGIMIWRRDMHKYGTKIFKNFKRSEDL